MFTQLIAAEASYFVLIQSNQRPSNSEIMSAIKKTNNLRINQVGRNASLPHGPFTHKAWKPARAGIFLPGLPYRFETR